jgi:hypothetical protein
MHARISAGRVPTLLTNVGLLASGVGSSAIISRSLGPVARGEYVAWQTWAASAAILALGGVPQSLVLGQSTLERHKLMDVALILAATLVCACPLVLGLVMTFSLDWLVVAGAVLVAMATQLGAIGAAEAQRIGHMGVEFNVARIVPQVASLVAMAGLLCSGSSSAVSWLLVIGGCQTLATMLWVASRTRRGRSSASTVRATLRRSFRIAPGNWVTLLQYRLDILLVAALYQKEIVAYYAIGAAAQSAVLAVGQSTGMYWFSRRTAGGTDRQRRLRAELIKTAAIALVAAVPIAATSGFWVGQVYGEAFLPALPIVAVLCCVGVVQSLDYLLAHECLMSGPGTRTVLWRLPSLLVMTFGCWAAIHGSWPVVFVAAISGAGHLLSSAVFRWTLRTRMHALAPSFPPLRSGVTPAQSSAFGLTGGRQHRGNEDASDRLDRHEDKSSLLPRNSS